MKLKKLIGKFKRVWKEEGEQQLLLNHVVSLATLSKEGNVKNMQYRHVRIKLIFCLSVAVMWITQ